MTKSAHIGLALQGVEIIGNGSGSHHELRKLKRLPRTDGPFYSQVRWNLSVRQPTRL